MIFVYFVQNNRGIVNRLIQVLGRSRLTHCCYGCGSLVIDFGFRGQKWWWPKDFLPRYPGLRWEVQIPADGPYPLPINRPVRILPTLARWLLRLPIQTDDCVQQTADVLRRAGVEVPRVTTPDDLFAFLRTSGYPVVNLERRSADDPTSKAVQDADRHPAGDARRS